MSSAFRRRHQKELQQAREAAVHRRTELVPQLGEDRREDASLLIQGKHAELHGSGFYSIGQIEEVNAIIAAYALDEFDAAVALAKSRNAE